jgi:Polysaccharide deacetylase
MAVGAVGAFAAPAAAATQPPPGSEGPAGPPALMPNGQVATSPQAISPQVSTSCPAAPYGAQSAAPGSGKTVALTFDDGPGASTASILSILAQYSVPATFFNIGLNGTHPGAVKFEYAPNGVATGPKGVATGLCVSDPGGGWASDPLRDGLILTACNTGPWQQFIPQPNGTLKNVATGLYVSPNGTAAQLRGTPAPSLWGGSAYTWTDYAHLPG